ncbi:MAG TPA: TolC family protein [Bryobacteraceae bacterium]
MKASLLLILAAPLAAPLAAQDPLSLKDAVERALAKHPSIEAARQGVKAAEMGVAESRSGYLPKLNYAESWQRSNNPVFVFSSLLTQHQFDASNFQLGPLNRPDALNNFQSQLTLDEVVFDAGQTRRAVRSAELGRDITGEDERRNRMNVIAGVVRAYHGAVLAAEGVKVAGEALRSAEADLNRAKTVRAAGMSTDADVLSIQVHLAAMREQQIRRNADWEVALAALNEAIGLPLSEAHELRTPLTAVAIDNRGLAAYEKDGVETRPDLRQSRLQTSLAETQSESARAAMLPQVILHAGFEADRQRFVNRGGANWLAAATLRWNIFNGGADKARIEQAASGLGRARALGTQAEAQVRLQVRRAWADLRSATERIGVAEGAVTMAEESLRITKNRFDAGLATVTDLLRTETALLEVRDRRLAAVYDQRLAAVNLELASGRLSPTSEVLN